MAGDEFDNETGSFFRLAFDYSGLLFGKMEGANPDKRGE